MLGEVPAGYQQIITISLVKNCLILFNFYFFSSSCCESCVCVWRVFVLFFKYRFSKAAL